MLNSNLYKDLKKERYEVGKKKRVDWMKGDKDRLAWEAQNETRGKKENWIPME